MGVACGLWLVDEKGELREEGEGNETNKASVWEQLIQLKLKTSC